MSDLRYWLALNSIPEIGPVFSRRLITAFGSPESVFHASLAELREIEDVGESRANNIVDFDNWKDIDRDIGKAEREGIGLLTIDNEVYPEGIRRLNDAPIVLSIRGTLNDSDRYAVAMVGSRNSTKYGLQMADRISHKLAASGLTVISGMARGIDSAGHLGALRAGGRTIAVLGSGIDVPYPPENAGLMQKIQSSGVVMSEFPFRTPPNRENFPRRNRIISALSLGVVVVEATLDSGSLITVGYALDQGREIFAVPGNATSRSSKGTNDLIKKGAKLVENAEEVIDELRPLLKGIIKEDKLKSEKELPEMTDDEKALYGHLSSEPRHIDNITRGINMAAPKVLSVLLSLELKGVVRQSTGKQFAIN